MNVKTLLAFHSFEALYLAALAVLPFIVVQKVVAAVIITVTVFLGINTLYKKLTYKAITVDKQGVVVTGCDTGKDIRAHNKRDLHNLMGESNTVVSAYTLYRNYCRYTLYRHLQQYCSHPSIFLHFKVQIIKKSNRHLQQYCSHPSIFLHFKVQIIKKSKGGRYTVISAYTLYRHLQQYCSHPSKCTSNLIKVFCSYSLEMFQYELR